MLELFGSVWENFSMDFCGLLLSGEYLFVIIDVYICYLVVEVVWLVVVKIVIFVLDKVISVYGILCLIKMDNGSLF